MNDIGLDFKVIGAQLSISKQLFLVDISFQQCPACSLCSPCCFVANCLDINHAESFPFHYQLKNLAHPKLKLVVQFPWKYSFKKGLVFVEEYLYSVEKNVLKPPLSSLTYLFLHNFFMTSGLLCSLCGFIMVIQFTENRHHMMCAYFMIQCWYFQFYMYYFY